MSRGTNGSSSSSTILRTIASERSRAPRIYSSLRSSSPAMVAAEIMPRSATTQTRPMEKRSRKRSTTGNSVVTSAVFPGHISVQIGRPWIPERSATCLREADLNVLSKLGNQGLEWRLEPDAFTGREVCREDDLLDVLVGCPVDIQVARQPST